MNVQIKHNGTDITGFVESYEREHKICTGIGTLRAEVIRTIPRTFDPWDSIDIYENGSFKVRYYISDVQDTIPAGHLVLDCQDISKRLVDYFIPDSYTIDYPSYTRYWIEKFLTEAGVDYTFNTSSQGQLISNNTQLGLTPVYEQLLTLLQMSGWYIYFNQAEEAVIGPLNAELAISNRSIDKTDILDISRNSDDKMLRNRALVLGTFDPYTLSYASADVTVHTRWNYDHNDVRAVVISNSNIPNKGSAYSIANQLIKEFARITIEKHITVWGARDYNLGDAIRVNSTVWKGKGLITTFGTSMSKQGLVTRLILDERCPRLFGFFDFGDYVYVGTYGDGIWKKHIKFDPTWYDFSTGLTDPCITDLHINNGVFGSVAASGEMYRTFEEGGWIPVTVTGLMSSLDDTIASGMPITYVGFSGLMGRAVIVDKFTNNIKFGIDTYSGMNYGDYFMDFYGSGGVNFSGVMASGSMRGWIVEYDPFTGNPVGDLGSGIYPISYSGNYAMAVVDLENDGYNDYVSVRTTGQSIPGNGVLWDFGTHYTQPFSATKDYESYAIAPSLTSYVNDIGDSIQTTLNVGNKSSLVAKDDALNGVQKAFAIGKDKKGRLLTITKLPDNTLTTSVLTSTLAASFTGEVIAIWPEWYLNTFKVFYRTTTGINREFRYIIWDANSNTWGSSVLIGTSNVLNPLGSGSFDADFTPDSVVVDNKCYVLRYYTDAPTPVGGFYKSASYLYVYLHTVDIELSTLTETLLLEFITTDWDGDTNFDIIPGNTHTSPEALGSFNRTTFGIFQQNNGVQIIGWTEAYKREATARSREYVFHGNQLGLTEELIYDNPTFRFGANATSTIRSQLTLDKGMIGRTSGDVGDGEFSYNGSVFSYNVSTGSLPYYKDVTKIYPMLNTANHYIALNGTTFVLCDAVNMVNVSNITPPTGHGLIKPMSSPIKFIAEEIYFLSLDGATFEYNYIPYNFDTFNLVDAMKPDNILGGFRGINFGGFFIAEPVDFTVGSPLALIVYIDMGEPDYGGGTYMVLQREGSDFNLIQTASYPIRLDISNNAPVWTVGSGENTFVSNFVYDQTLEQIIFVSGQPVRVDDFRYTYLEPTFSGISNSGLAIQTMGLYVTASGVFGGDITTYSGGFSLLLDVPSGWGTRIETSNYGLGGQYVFITTSGDVSMFYQKDPMEYSFTSYSGLPDSRATIIRLDDRI